MIDGNVICVVELVGRNRIDMYKLMKKYEFDVVDFC